MMPTTPAKKRGRPVGTKRGPTRSVRKRLSDAYSIQLARGWSFARAARKATGDINGNATLHQYRLRYRDHYTLLRVSITSKYAVTVARELLPGLRRIIEQAITASIDNIDKPGGRRLATEMRSEPHRFCDGLELALALNLVRRFKDGGLSNQDANKIINEWVSETLVLLKQGFGYRKY